MVRNTSPASPSVWAVASRANGDDDVTPSAARRADRSPGTRSRRSPRIMNRSHGELRATMPAVRVLVTNDDGVFAPGLAVLAMAAAELGHQVAARAPTDDRSGAGAALGPLPEPNVVRY